MGTIFHIAKKEKWKRSSSRSQYTEDSLQSEGFIHCSTAEQLVDTANKHFKGQSDLVLLKINTNDIVSVIAYEANAENGETYPHIFGPITHDAIKEVIEFPVSSDGTFSLPPALKV
ncbi:MAG: DUF952 domain-containing protein [Chloroflexota bacterium]|nr:DUF952 domain-containing protein [Chloroflexota bacterium]